MKCQIKIRYKSKVNVVTAAVGTNLMTLLSEHGYSLDTPCGGKGTCGKCQVKIRAGEAPVSEADKLNLTESALDAGFRLACRLSISNDLEVDLTETEELVILASTEAQDFQLDSHFKQRVIQLDTPEIVDQRDFLARIHEQLNTKSATLNSVVALGKVDKKAEFLVTYYGDKIVNISENLETNTYGIAVDIGTTTIVMYLIDLESGKEINSYPLQNPQRKFGADVITRIDYVMQNVHGLKELKEAVIDALNQGIDRLTRDSGIDSDDIYHMVLVGNTVMLHLLLGIDPISIAHAPYIPIFTDGWQLEPTSLNLNICADGIVELLPVVASYVGADLIADLLVADLDFPDWKLLVDIGTNGEIVLGNQDQLLTCSAAAGPAFEGAKITFGMSGVPGAISSYQLNKDGKVEYETIGNQKPKGICGSGLVDIIAQLYINDLLDETGAFQSSNNESYFGLYRGEKAYRVVPGEEIFLTQKDVREYQLAAGAISAGIKVLVDQVGIDYAQISQFYLAGGFGNYITPQSAVVLGLIPRELESNVIKIGNGAGAGAQQYLLDQSASSKINQMRRRIKYIELSARADFQEKFMDAMFFPPR